VVHLQGIHNYARQHLKLASERMNTRYGSLDSCAGYHEGDSVALSPNPQEGEIAQVPVEVIIQISDVVYRIQRNTISRLMVVHLDRLAPYQVAARDERP
jgi:hypothetical protein